MKLATWWPIVIQLVGETDREREIDSQQLLLALFFCLLLINWPQVGAFELIIIIKLCSASEPLVYTYLSRFDPTCRVVLHLNDLGERKINSEKQRGARMKVFCQARERE